MYERSRVAGIAVGRYVALPSNVLFLKRYIDDLVLILNKGDLAAL